MIEILSNTGLILDIIGCLSWPESPSHGCSESGENWKALDTSLSYSDSAACELLCLSEQQDGCCYLKTGVGCYWKQGGIAGFRADLDAMTVTCRAGNNLVLNCFDSLF